MHQWTFENLYIEVEMQSIKSRVFIIRSYPLPLSRCCEIDKSCNLISVGWRQLSVFGSRITLQKRFLRPVAVDNPKGIAQCSFSTSVSPTLTLDALKSPSLRHSTRTVWPCTRDNINIRCTWSLVRHYSSAVEGNEKKTSKLQKHIRDSSVLEQSPEDALEMKPVHQGQHRSSERGHKTEPKPQEAGNTKQGPLARRPAKKKQVASAVKDDFLLSKAQKFSVWAYSTAEAYNFETLVPALKKKGLYVIQQNPPDLHNVVRVEAAYKVQDEPREITFFHDGVVVFWNVEETERKQVLSFLKRLEINPYDASVISKEADYMQYLNLENEAPRLLQGKIILDPQHPDHDLVKFAYSNVLAISVKLGVWENSLGKYVDSMKWVSDQLKDGQETTLTKRQLMKKAGELFTLKHLINLGSDLLDDPDFYWDRDELHDIFKQTSVFFNISRRTKVINEKLSHCQELLDLMLTNINDKHHVRLEWFIIILIMVEVGFELLHFVERVL